MMSASKPEKGEVEDCLDGDAGGGDSSCVGASGVEYHASNRVSAVPSVQQVFGGSRNLWPDLFSRLVREFRNTKQFDPSST